MSLVVGMTNPWSLKDACKIIIWIFRSTQGKHMKYKYCRFKCLNYNTYDLDIPESIQIGYNWVLNVYI